MAGSLVAQQDNSYANRLRFKRGKIARISYQKPFTVPQALVTPGVQNYESAYMTVQDGRIFGTYRQINSAGNLVQNNTCCTATNVPNGAPIVPPPSNR
jgi:hypothetical protein